MSRAPDQRLEALQALRAIAAGFVVFVHALDTYADKIGPVGPIHLGVDLGGFGVKLFFCISGYIIFSSSWNLAPGWSSVSFFARRRLIRIVPLYWAATLIYAAKLALQGNAPEWWELVCSLLFIPYTDAHGLMRPVLGAGWTLNFEMLFYTALTLALVLDRAYRLASVAAFFVLLLVLRGMGTIPAEVAAHSVAWALLADPHLMYFLAGMLIGTLAPRLSAWMPLPRRWRTGMACTALLLMGYLALAFHGLIPAGWREPVELAVCTAILLVCVQPYAAPPDGRHAQLRHWVVAAGDGSYSTYLIHGFVMGPVARVFSALSLHLPPLLFAAAMVLVCTLAGIAVFRLFEAPVTRTLNKRWGRAQTI